MTMFANKEVMLIADGRSVRVALTFSGDGFEVALVLRPGETDGSRG